jgi:hypothetical protein
MISVPGGDGDLRPCAAHSADATLAGDAIRGAFPGDRGTGRLIGLPSAGRIYSHRRRSGHGTSSGVGASSYVLR